MYGRNFLPQGWWNTGTDCPESQWRPHPLEHARPGWKALWAAWSNWRCPYSLQGGWARWSLRSLPTQSILRFYDSKRPQDISCAISCSKQGKLLSQTNMLRAFIQLGLHLQERRLHNLSGQSAALPGCLQGERPLFTSSVSASFFNLWRLSVVFPLCICIKTLFTSSHSESQQCLQCFSAFTVRFKNTYSEHETLRATYFMQGLKEQNSSWIFLFYGHFIFILISTLLEE